MLLRLLSTLILAPIAIVAIWLGGAFFALLVMLGGGIAIAELLRVTRPAESRGVFNRAVWCLAGIVYIVAACFALLYLRAESSVGLGMVLSFFVVVWGTDIGAYFTGRTLGGPRLAPSISPNKTWSGAVGGLIFGVFAGILTARGFGLPYSSSALIAAAIAVSIAAQIGDLIESFWKRQFGVKDSGRLIPGHGGILDRIDGVLLAAPVAAAGQWVAHGGGLPWK